MKFKIVKEDHEGFAMSVSGSCKRLGTIKRKAIEYFGSFKIEMVDILEVNDAEFGTLSNKFKAVAKIIRL